ncbi:MAG: ABC transporter ATP-binding protein [Planctomycetes bacterium]|nr:ABC transporter ATP-binding protein [Planctomycetota bacterium]
MSDTIIKVDGISKEYRIGGTKVAGGNLRESVVNFCREQAETLKSILSGAAPDSGTEKFWALDDVSFEVKEGEVVGIIGRNGAGKSTLLKILSRITEPTRGWALMNGRVGSLLEVGTGFHQALSGRENIFLSGAILGMARSEIKKKFDEIVDFAGIDKFIDTPVKRYSSGMQVRLGFAVAAHLEPEILIIDEVLAVGDVAFQRKCLGKMDEVSKSGRTVLFVSHNMPAVRSLCTRSILLEEGKLVYDGSSDTCIDKYMERNISMRRDGDLSFFRRDRITDATNAFMKNIRVTGGQRVDEHLPSFTSGEDVEIVMEYEVRRPVRGASLTLNLNKLEGDKVSVIYTGDKDLAVDMEPGTSEVKCRIKGLPLTPGLYQMNFGLNESGSKGRATDYLVGVPLFEISEVPETGGNFPHRPWGAVQWSDVEWVMPCDVEGR